MQDGNDGDNTSILILVRDLGFEGWTWLISSLRLYAQTPSHALPESRTSVGQKKAPHAEFGLWGGHEARLPPLAFCSCPGPFEGPGKML